MVSLEHLRGDLAGIIVLGSASSVNDAEPWQLAMNAWLKPRLDAGIPTIGICYGHQLLAHLFGGKVDFVYPDRRKHSGFRKIQLQGNRLWNNQPLEGALAVSHNEAVLECPPDFEVIGTSPEIAIEAIAHRKLPIWGFQPHPESTEAFLLSRQIPTEQAREKLAFGHSLLKFFLSFAAK